MAPQRPCRCSPAPCRSWPLGRVAAPSAVSQRPTARAPGRVAIQPHLLLHCLSQYTVVYCNTNFPSQPTSLSQYNYCITTQNPQPPAASCHNTLTCIATHFSAHQASSTAIQCNTLRYNSQPTTPKLQYTFPSTAHPSCNTIPFSCNNFFFFSQYNWAVAQIRFCCTFKHNFFFSFFSFVFSFISSYWKMLKKIHISIFFSHTCYWKITQKHKNTFFFFIFL